MAQRLQSHLTAYLPTYLSIYLSTLCLSIYRSIYLFIYLSIYLSVYLLCINLSIYLRPIYLFSLAKTAVIDIWQMTPFCKEDGFATPTRGTIRISDDG